MVERVETGGLMSFDYSKSRRSKLSLERKREIDKAYGRYWERKKKERRNKIMIFIIIILVLLVLGAVFFRGS